MSLRTPLENPLAQPLCQEKGTECGNLKPQAIAFQLLERLRQRDAPRIFARSLLCLFLTNHFCN
ncbi:MAG: hypothetical protein HWQ23_06440 [Nostoc sp. JL33]|uniref:hypothetical protein n=1 Tax=Nostoc sp. JL33 TaxID=2815396 RepID=UPI0025FAD72C|nr:hypothetical protein [Nostoc sp. JL33]MBN3869942.1 hypothetical protein [Nostoc sp. JL33]